MAKQKSSKFSTRYSVKIIYCIQEEFRRLKVLRAGGKVRGVSVAAVNSDTAALSVLTANNIVEQFRMDLEEKEPECSSVRRLDHPGHRDPNQ